MDPTIKQVLLNTLEELTEEQLRRFCVRLWDRRREGEPRVQRRALEDQDRVRVVEVLVDVFTEEGAGRVVVETLRDIDLYDLAEKLETSLEMRPEEHFVDRHQSFLVDLITEVPAILGQLLDQEVVSKEQHDAILAKATTQGQVRQLYSGPLESSGIRGKDIFLKVLEELEPSLIEILMRTGPGPSWMGSPPTSSALLRPRLDKSNVEEWILSCSPSAVKTWDATMREVRPEEHFVDRHQSFLVDLITEVPAILGQLLDQEVVSKEQHDAILAKATTQDQVQQLYSGPLESSGIRGKDIFLKALEELDPLLIKYLMRLKSRTRPGPGSMGSPDFQHLLLELSNALLGDQLDQIKFLCPFIGKGLQENIHTGYQLFQVLMEHNKLSAHSTDLLRELLTQAGRPDLADQLRDFNPETDLRSEVESSSSGTSLRKDTTSMPVVDGSDEDSEEMHFKSQCEKCKAAQQSPDYEKVTPRKISQGRFQVQLEGEGTYECSVTGLVFEVSEQALVRYEVLPWFKFTEFLQNSWRIAGSIFDVDVVDKDASVLKFIQFPHSLCIADPEYEPRFSVLHVEGSHAHIEPAVDFSASHVRWRVSSLSPVGPIIQSIQYVKYHGVVLLYKELDLHSFQVFLALNTASEIQDIDNQVLSSGKKYIKITKPAGCTLEEKYYYLKSQPEGQIEPTKIKFIIGGALKSYFEASFNEHFSLTSFTLSLTDSATSTHGSQDCETWDATIREGDWEGKKVLKPWKRTRDYRERQTEEHFVDQYESSLVQRITAVPAILDQLRKHRVVSKEQYDAILAKATTQDQVRQLYSGPLESSGIRGKDIFLKVLEELDPFLIEDLRSQ